MMKKIIAVLLCIATMASTVCALASCSGYDKNEDKGQQFTMYLSDQLYNFDPAYAYTNESTLNVVSLIFDTLYTIDKNGKLAKGLVESCEIKEDKNAGEYIMYLKLNGNKWSDGIPVSANDVVYAWKRLLEPDASFPAAALLYDIKNARAVKEGEASIDDLGIYAEDTLLISIKFEGPIDYEQFKLNLTSLALAPLREESVTKGDDWSKKSTSILCSGPFKLSRISVATSGKGNSYTNKNYLIKNDNGKVVAAGEEANFDEFAITSFVLERNSYYSRDPENDSIKKAVTPYKIVYEASMTDEEIKEAYENGSLLYIGDIPLALREEYKDDAAVSDTMSANVIYLNENAEIQNSKTDKTEKLFADKNVRKALSMAIDRQAIADAIVFAEPATGLVPNKVFFTNSAKKTFRDSAESNYESLNNDSSAASSLLSGITPKNYSFEITYPAYDDVQTKIAEIVCESWKALGFKVTLKPLGTIRNQDYYKYTDSIPEDICDDMYAKAFNSSDYQVAISDMTAVSADPYSVLAPFAKAFSGQGMDMSDTENYQLTPHSTGYDSEEYNNLFEEIFTEKKISARGDNYLKAEAILMEDMPVIPTVFYKSAVLASKDLKNIKNNSYNYQASFTKVSMSNGNYADYIDAVYASIESRFETLKKDKASYFNNYKNDDFDTFKTETTIYTYVFDFLKPKD